ncbi:MAG: YncE family protein [Ginsengibacter sp.]
MKKVLIIISIATFLLANDNSYGQSSSGYHVANTFHVGGAGGWDYPAADAGSNKLYLSHGTQVNIIDKNSGDSIGVITDVTGVHGIAFVHALGKGYISDGRLNNVTVFDLASGKVIKQIPTGKNPDWIFYETFSKKIITSNHSGASLSVIDPKTDSVVATIAVAGEGLETIASDNAGKIFVSVEDKSEIAVVDMKKLSVIHRWSLAPGEGPTGLAIDVATKRLFSGCEKTLIVMDAVTGKVIDHLPIGDGCDGVAFDPARKLIFTANGIGTMTVIKEISANQYKVIDNITTKRGARTISLDQQTHAVYLPTGDYEPLPANAPKGTRPKIVEGSFQVLVVKK